MTAAIPPCPLFGQCGGCSTQHLPYPTQLANKQATVQALLKRYDLPLSDNPPPIHASTPYAYRNRMDFITTLQGLALRKKGRFDRTVPVATCPIANQHVNALLKEVNEWIKKNNQHIDVFNIKKATGTLRYAVIRASHNAPSSSITFVFNEESTKQAQQRSLIDAFAKTTAANNVLIAQTPPKRDTSTSPHHYAIKGTPHLTELLLGKPFQYHSQSFFQNNTAVTEAMLAHAKQLLSNNRLNNATLLDLYAGVGTFGLSLADEFHTTILVESSPESVACARHNVQALQCKNTHVLEHDCTNLSSLSEATRKLRSDESPLHVITDPPRAGMPDKTWQALLHLQPATITYISCNPSELAKELARIKHAYTLTSIKLFDLFPQTSHVEAIAHLKRQ
ncbi:23S rRNA (uracil(1939)-C(5))-methyltransferase RlmD [Candidatus Woesearchaeota archaeon]|nr:MAG: 23S rRNA (uracil(1939)-C(5))-methyltransferase RlmD [Candidatus Woesearchaeota archaeon]